MGIKIYTLSKRLTIKNYIMTKEEIKFYEDDIRKQSVDFFIKFLRKNPGKKIVFDKPILGGFYTGIKLSSTRDSLLQEYYSGMSWLLNENSNTKFFMEAIDAMHSNAYSLVDAY